MTSYSGNLGLNPTLKNVYSIEELVQLAPKIHVKISWGGRQSLEWDGIDQPEVRLNAVLKHAQFLLLSEFTLTTELNGRLEILEKEITRIFEENNEAIKNTNIFTRILAIMIRALDGHERYWISRGSHVIKRAEGYIWHDEAELYK